MVANLSFKHIFILLLMFGWCLSHNSSILTKFLSRQSSLYRDNNLTEGCYLEEPRALSELVLFIINSGTTHQISIIYDQSTPDISLIVRAISKQWGDVTISIYEEGNEFIEDLLRSKNQGRKMRNMVVICSGGNTRAIFDTVMKKNLESPNIQWYVILHEDIRGDLAASLREGTQVTMAMRSSANSYLIWTSSVGVDNKISLREIGRVTYGSKHCMKPFLSEPMTSDLQTSYKDFGGRRLKGAVVPNWPFFEVESLETFEGPYRRAMAVSGIDYNVIGTLASELNFTYELLETDSWGGPQADGSVSGMIGMVARREVDFAIDEITITGAREVVMDFTSPYFMEAITIVSRAPREKSRTAAVFSPFTPLVWLSLMVAVILMGPVLAILNWLMGQHPFETTHYPIHEYWFNAFRNLVVQGNRIASSLWPQRFVFFSWYLFCFYVCALYSGTLTAVLAIPSFEKPIDSLSDLLAAMKSTGFNPLFIYDTSNVHIIREAKSGIYKEIWNRFDAEDGYVDSANEGIDKVLTGKYGFINAWLASEIRITARGRNKYYMARQTYYPQSYGIALSSGAPYIEVFNEKLSRLVESGLIDKWTRDEVRKVSGSGTTDEGPEETSGTITMTHLQAAFFLLGMGLLLGGVVLLGEVLYCRRKKDRRGRRRPRKTTTKEEEK